MRWDCQEELVFLWMKSKANVNLVVVIDFRFILSLPLPNSQSWHLNKTLSNVEIKRDAISGRLQTFGEQL